MSILYRNKSETLTQNYRRLGLASRLNAVTGGVEKLRGGSSQSKTSTTSRLAISAIAPKEIAPSEARVERDPKTGKILRVIHEDRKPNPLNDPLNSESEVEDFEGFGDGGTSKERRNEIVTQLEDHAARPEKKKERYQSKREREWIERLVEKHGDAYEKMFWDRKLNPMQQTVADIKKRVEKWRASGGEGAA